LHLLQPSKLQRVRVIAARCETSSYDMLMYLFERKKNHIKLRGGYYCKRKISDYELEVIFYLPYY
jgi:hypothetical protein